MTVFLPVDEGIVAEIEDRIVEITMEQEVDSVVQPASQGNFLQHLDLTNKTGYLRKP